MKDTIIKVSKDCVFEELDDEIIILNIETGIYHQLSFTGSIIWKILVNKEITQVDLIQKLKLNFNDKSLDEDVELFLKDMHDRGLIVRV